MCIGMKYITVDYQQKDKFIDFCTKAGIKTLHIDMDIMSDIMTCTKVYCTDKEAINMANIYALLLEFNGFDVVRIKVEAENSYEKEYLYIETHLKFSGIMANTPDLLVSRNMESFL